MTLKTNRINIYYRVNTYLKKIYLKYKKVANQMEPRL